MKFCGVLFEKLGNHGARVDRHFEVEWDQFAVEEVFRYEDDSVEKDEQRLWSASKYREGANRGNAGLEYCYAAILDNDCCDVGEMEQVVRFLRDRGQAFIVYTSWSHRRPEKFHRDTDRHGPFDCFRIVLPFSRTVSEGEYRAVVQGVFGYEVPNNPESYSREAHGRTVVLPNGKERASRPRGWDPVSMRPSQGYYVPAPWAELEVYAGDALDVDAVLRRPQTPRPSSRLNRPHQAPSISATGALGALHRALLRAECPPEEPGFSGWSRSQCPSCKDPSPSLITRANGDGIDVHDFAGCKRKDVLLALGLDESKAFAPPTDLRVALDEQLAGQNPGSPAVGVVEAVGRLTERMAEALADRTPTVFKYPAGTGKSHASAIDMATEARNGYKIAYATQEHAVAHETRMKLPPDIRSRSVHIHSPLIQVGDGPVCQRAAELSERVFEFGLSLMGKVCPRCPFRADCGALAEARARAAALPEAQIIFVSHAGIRQVFAGDKGADLKLIVDEMPSTYTELSVTMADIQALAAQPPLPSADAVTGKLAYRVAQWWLHGGELGDIRFGDRSIGKAEDILREAGGRVRIKEHARPSSDEKKLLRIADKVLRIALHQLDGEHVGGVLDIRDGRWVMEPDACHQTLLDRQGILLSATPMMHALPHFKLEECEVLDSAPVRRLMVLRGRRGSTALTKAYYDDNVGLRRIREAAPGEAPGIPWADVEAALVRARAEAQRYECKRVLFVTFKALADVLRDQPERIGTDIVVAHFGALRGKNDWMEGRPLECSVVYCFGTPRFDMRPTLLQLGLLGDAADQAWVAFAAGELAQAEGRLRLPRRTKPCSVLVEGDVAPSSWYPDLVTDVVEQDDLETPMRAFEGVLVTLPLAEAREEGLDASLETGLPLPDLELTNALRRLDMFEGIRRLNAATEGRRKRFDDTFTFLGDDNDQD